jgi:hypothetical protein
MRRLAAVWLAALACTVAVGSACECLVCEDGSEVKDQTTNKPSPGEPAFNCAGKVHTSYKGKPMDLFTCNVKKIETDASGTKKAIGHCKSIQESAHGAAGSVGRAGGTGGGSDPSTTCSGVKAGDGVCQTCKAVRYAMFEKIGNKEAADGCAELRARPDITINTRYPHADAALCDKHKNAFSFNNIKAMKEEYDRFEHAFWPPKPTSVLANANTDLVFHYNCAMIGCCERFPISCGSDEEGLASERTCAAGQIPERFHRPFKGRLCRKKGVKRGGTLDELMCVPSEDGLCPDTHEDCARFATDMRSCDASCSTGVPVLFETPALSTLGTARSLREITGLPEEKKSTVCCQRAGQEVFLAREDACATNEQVIAADRATKLELLAKGTVREFACCMEPRTEPTSQCTKKSVNDDRVHKWARDPRRKLEDELFRVEVRKQRWRDLQEHERELTLGEEQWRPAGERSHMQNVGGRNLGRQLVSGLRGSHDISTVTREISGELPRL